MRRALGDPTKFETKREHKKDNFTSLLQFAHALSNQRKIKIFGALHA